MEPADVSTVTAPIVLTINVGGREFTALDSTFRKIPFFAAALRSGMAWPRFIDRDPKAFEQILNAARDEQYTVDPIYAPDVRFYGITTVEYTHPYCEGDDARNCDYGHPEDRLSSIYATGGGVFTFRVIVGKLNYIRFKLQPTSTSNPLTYITKMSKYNTYAPYVISMFHNVALPKNLRDWLNYDAAKTGWHTVFFPCIKSVEVSVEIPDAIDVVAGYQRISKYDKHQVTVEIVDNMYMCKMSRGGYTPIWCAFSPTPEEPFRTVSLATINKVPTNIFSVINLLKDGCEAESYCYSHPPCKKLTSLVTNY